MKPVAPTFPALARFGHVRAAVADGVCQAGAKADIRLQTLIERSDRAWRKRLPYGLSPATFVAVATQIGIALAGLDAIPSLPDETASLGSPDEFH